jgi:hypothetical protein
MEALNPNANQFLTEATNIVVSTAWSMECR